VFFTKAVFGCTDIQYRGTRSFSERVVSGEKNQQNRVNLKKNTFFESPLIQNLLENSRNLLHADFLLFVRITLSSPVTPVVSSKVTNLARTSPIRRLLYFLYTWSADCSAPLVQIVDQNCRP
jgi:hypothetical protein